MTFHSNKLPDHFSEADGRRLLTHLSQRVTASRPYEGKWEAPFLLSHIYSPVWLLRTADAILRNGEWLGASKFEWSILLPNGTALTDAVNESLLRFCQKTTFLVRVLPGSPYQSATSLKLFIYTLLMLVRWGISKGKRLSVQTHHFSRLCTEHLDSVLISFGEAGILGVMKYRECFLQRSYWEATGTRLPVKELNNVYAVSEPVRASITAWLEKEGYFRNAQGASYKGLMVLDRNKVASLLTAEMLNLGQDKFIAFLRQFEPTVANVYPRLCVPAFNTGNEFPSHRMMPIEEVINRRATATSMSHTIIAFRKIFSLSRHLPNSLPAPDSIKFERFTRHIKDASPGQHTPWIPLDISFIYIRESLRWVTVYGPSLTDFYLKAIDVFTENEWLGGDTSQTILLRLNLRDKWVQKNLPEALFPLNISRWSSATDDVQVKFEELRSSPSVMNAMKILVGACSLLITSLKPMREKELLSLPRACLTFRKNDGYWLKHERAKAALEDRHMNMQAPIPTVAAQAVQIMARLGFGIEQFCEAEVPNERGYLFYLPDFSGTASPIASKKQSRPFLHTALDNFCDYVAPPPDNLGRRWYIRVHEQRKAFLICFLWCFKYAGVDAAAEIAGHFNRDQLMAYIQANFPGVELPDLEAGYLAETLWNFFAGHKKQRPIENIEKIYQAVCKHFRVTEISEVNEKDLEDWLRICFSENTFEMVLYNLSATSQNKSLFALKIVVKDKKPK